MRASCKRLPPFNYMHGVFLVGNLETSLSQQQSLKHVPALNLHPISPTRTSTFAQ